jgi:hypothetical protein
MLVTTLIPLFNSVSAIDEINIKIHMIGEDEKTRFESPVIVAGIWHFINVTFEETNFQNLFLKLFKGDSIPETIARNESNYYEWKYNSNSQEYIDINEYEGYSYIDVNRSEKNNNIYSFCLGLKDTFPEIEDYWENWTLEIYKDTIELYSTNVVLEKPLVGLSRSHADSIKFHINPFQEIIAQGDDYFIIENVGNVPLITSIDYPSYNDILDIINSSDILSAKNSLIYNITLNSKSWKPGILEIPGFVYGAIPSNLIITVAAFTFKPNITIDAADLEISVGHSNYKIEPIPGSNIVFQYEEELEMYEGEIKDIIVYLSGDGRVTLDVTDDGENVDIIKVTTKDKIGTPLTITSTNTSEYEIVIQVEAIRENKVGIINYELEIDGKIQTYETQISIGPPQNEETSEGINLPISTLIIILLIIIVIGYIIFTQFKHRRR